MSDAAARSEPGLEDDPVLEDYPVRRVFPTRWNDDDRFGHLNNTVYYSAMDTTITGWLLAGDDLGLLDGGFRPVVVQSSCSYRRSVGYPDVLEVGLRSVRVGGSSMTYDLGIFVQADGGLVARGTWVHVGVDPGTGRPVPVPDSLRERLAGITG
ncbi:thioesterase family protein [Pseudokineococcus basanitobsidens]|uniref:Thioesterase family protein n=1 Tax=Pseudokineococcus basanitobsidens TaxID=1926649 RepID=A0ABU8RFX4_9ACTN